MNTCLVILLLVMFVEALTEILVASSILSWPREFIARHNGLLGELVHCGYCTSVWVSATVAWIIPMYIWVVIPQFWLGYVIMTFVLHRLSNVLHELLSKLFNRRPVTFAVHKTETVLMPDLGNEYDAK